MTVDITYMGTKRDLAPLVAKVIAGARSGPLLDCFSGMCSVGQSVAPLRQVWTNDAQKFAADVGAALFTSSEDPVSALAAADLNFDMFETHRSRLTRYWAPAIAKEAEALAATAFDEFNHRHEQLTAIVRKLTPLAPRNLASLFSRFYANTYIGVRQAIEIDSIVAALRRNNAEQKISSEQRRWLTIGLGRALLRTSTSTGHFAQFLTPKRSNFRRFQSQRRRAIWQDWLSSVDALSAIRTPSWRKSNRAFHDDALELIPKIARSKTQPAVVYADPPYTDDQYSRFYHLFETLTLYDYPKLAGKGLYRSRRFGTDFSRKAQVDQAFEKLCSAVQRMGSDLVVSYPTSGLLYQQGSSVELVLRKHFMRVERCFAVPANHSTMGASKGAANLAVTEQIFLAQS